MLRAILREPLVHFVVAGAALFGAWSWLGPDAGPEADPQVIVLDQATLDNLTNLWKSQ